MVNLQQILDQVSYDQSYINKGLLTEPHYLQRIAKCALGFQSLKSSNSSHLVISNSVLLEDRQSLDKVIKTLSRFFKTILLTPSIPEHDINGTVTLVKKYLKKKHVSRQVLIAAAQGSSHSRFRSLDALRHGLRILKQFGHPTIGAIVKINCFDKLRDEEISFIQEVMAEYLGLLEFDLLIHQDVNKPSFTLTIIGIGCDLHVQDDLGIDLFEMEPESKSEQILDVSLPIPRADPS